MLGADHQVFNAGNYDFDVSLDLPQTNRSLGVLRGPTFKAFTRFFYIFVILACWVSIIRFFMLEITILDLPQTSRSLGVLEDIILRTFFAFSPSCKQGGLASLWPVLACRRRLIYSYNVPNHNLTVHTFENSQF